LRRTASDNNARRLQLWRLPGHRTRKLWSWRRRGLVRDLDPDADCNRDTHPNTNAHPNLDADSHTLTIAGSGAMPRTCNLY
jgi:hypothetical protein